MKFAVSLVRLLCGLVAGVLLVAYLYFSVNYEQTGVAGSHTLALACLFLFAAALLIWGVLAVMSDIWLKRLDNKEFYQKLLREGYNGNIATDLLSAENTQQFSNLLNQINAANEDSKQTLLSGFRDLNEKLQVLNTEETSNGQKTLVDEVRMVSKNMSEVQTQIESLLSQLQQQKKILSQLTDYPSKSTDGEMKFYPVLQEEAGYPESVIDYGTSIPDANTEPLDFEAEVNQAQTPIDAFIDEPLENLLDEESELPEPQDNQEIQNLAEETVEDAISADLDADEPSKSPINLDEPVDINAIEPAANTKKNEPNLEQIFNDELASELADLEILNGKPTAKTQDDIDLEQFFAGHRKAIDQQ